VCSVLTDNHITENQKYDPSSPIYSSGSQGYTSRVASTYVIFVELWFTVLNYTFQAKIYDIDVKTINFEDRKLSTVLTFNISRGTEL